MKRPIPIATTVANAPGVRRAWQDRLFNLYPEVPAPRTGDTELSLGLRSASGERLVVSPRRIAQAVGEVDAQGNAVNSSLLGFAWVQHQTIPDFQDKILIVGTKGVALLDPDLEDEDGFQIIEETKASLGIGAYDLGAEVMIVSSGSSWLITQPASGRAWIYKPVRADANAPWKGELTEIKALEPELNNRPFTEEEVEEIRELREEAGDPLPSVASNDSVVDRFSAAIYHGNRYIVAQRGTGVFFWSGLVDTADETIFYPLEFATAESSGDPLVSLATNRQMIYMLGSSTTELWYQNSNANPTSGFGPYIHSVGGDLDRGCVGPFAATASSGNVFWLSHDGSVFSSGDRGGAQRVSSPALAELIDTEIRAGSGRAVPRDLTRSRMFSWSENGHDFVAIRPERGFTYVFDIETGAFHQRGGDYNEPIEEERPWRIRDVISSTRNSDVFGRTSNAIYVFTPEKSAVENEKGEAGEMRRMFITPVIENDRENITLNALEALVQGEDRDEQLLGVEVSWNRGFSWEPLVREPIRPEEGGVEYALNGVGRDLNFRFSHSSEGALTVFAVYADLGFHAIARDDGYSG